MNSGDCAQFNSAGAIVDAGRALRRGDCADHREPVYGGRVSAGIRGTGRAGLASSCTNSGGRLACPGGFAGYVTWPAGSGANNRQILGPAGAFTTNFNYIWADAIPAAATLMKIGTPSGGASTLGRRFPTPTT